MVVDGPVTVKSVKSKFVPAIDAGGTKLSKSVVKFPELLWAMRAFAGPAPLLCEAKEAD